MKKAFKVLLLWCVAIYIFCGVYTASTHVRHEPLFDSLHPPIKYKYYKTRAGEVEISYYANGMVYGKFEARKGQGNTTWFYYDENKSLEVAAKKLKYNKKLIHAQVKYCQWYIMDYFSFSYLKKHGNLTSTGCYSSLAHAQITYYHRHLHNNATPEELHLRWGN